MSEDWIIVCDEKNLILKKNDNNDYSLSFDINENSENDFSVQEIINSNQFFELLYELNKDIIENITDSSENSINNVNNLIIKIKNLKSEFKTLKNINIHLKFIYKFENNETSLCSIPFDNNFVSTEDNLYISTFLIKFKQNKPTNVLLTFKIDDIVDNDIFQMYLGLYFKKLFYRFKMYFE